MYADDHEAVIECGLLQCFPPKTVIIVAENWPVWALLCPALNFNCSVIYCDHSLSRSLLSAFMPMCTWHPLSAFLSHMPFRADFLLLSGSLAWVHTLLATCDISSLASPLLITLDLNSGFPPRDSFFQWSKITHHSLGGVLADFWFLGHSLPLAGSPIPPTYARRLRHHLSSTVSPYLRVCDPPPTTASTMVSGRRCPSGVVNSNGLITASHCATAKVSCPSVFTPTGWCIRRLTIRELGIIYDLPVQFIASLPSELRPSSLPWLRTAPLKVMRAFYAHTFYPLISGGGYNSKFSWGSKFRSRQGYADIYTKLSIRRVLRIRQFSALTGWI